MKKAIQLIDQDLTKFEDYFSKAVKSNAPLLDRIMQYIVKRKGKQMRPMFVLLSAKLGGEITTSLIGQPPLLNYCIQPHLCMMMW